MNFGELTDLLYGNPVAVVAIVAILAAVLGGRLSDDAPRLGKALNHGGYVGMAAAVMLVVVQAVGNAKHSDAALLIGQHPNLTVQGGETVVPKASDGHFWVEATVDGKSGWFLIDTGASYTGISPAFAEQAGIVPDPLKMPVDLHTANGTITARLGSIGKLHFGNVTVTDLEAAISPVRDEDTNLIGMNLLSRLSSWRVEGDHLVLVPKS